MAQLDELDQRLLRELAANGRLSNIDLAKRLPLSHSAISRRIARLEKSGVIKGYGAAIDPAAIGLTIRAFVGIRRDPSASVGALSEALSAIEGVEGCWIVTGEQDFMADVRARDMASLSTILLDRIQKVPGVLSTLSTFVLADLTRPALPPSE